MTDDVDALIAWNDEMFTAWGEDAFATMAAKHRATAAALRAQQERIDALEATLREARWLLGQISIAPLHARAFRDDLDRVTRRCAALTGEKP